MLAARTIITTGIVTGRLLPRTRGEPCRYSNRCCLSVVPVRAIGVHMELRVHSVPAAFTSAVIEWKHCVQANHELCSSVYALSGSDASRWK